MNSRFDYKSKIAIRKFEDRMKIKRNFHTQSTLILTCFTFHTSSSITNHRLKTFDLLCIRLNYLLVSESVVSALSWLPLRCLHNSILISMEILLDHKLTFHPQIHLFYSHRRSASEQHSPIARCCTNSPSTTRNILCLSTAGHAAHPIQFFQLVRVRWFLLTQLDAIVDKHSAVFQDGPNRTSIRSDR